MVTLPPLLPLSSDRLEPRGILLLDTSVDLLLWIGRAAPVATLTQLFGVTNVSELDPSTVRSSRYLVEAHVAIRFPFLKSTMTTTNE